MGVDWQALEAAADENHAPLSELLNNPVTPLDLAALNDPVTPLDLAATQTLPPPEDVQDGNNAAEAPQKGEEASGARVEERQAPDHKNSATQDEKAESAEAKAEPKHLRIRLRIKTPKKKRKSTHEDEVPKKRRAKKKLSTTEAKAIRKLLEAHKFT